MNQHARTLIATLLSALALTGPLAQAADGPGAETVRPAGYQPIAGDAKLGKKLFNATRLSSNGNACATCHARHGAFSTSFAKPYPHTVAMARDQLGRDPIHLDEMVQACMIMPMAAPPLPWSSKELAALTAYVQTLQKTFKPSR